MQSLISISFVFFSEKEADMNRRYDELNRELRMLMAIEGTYTTLSILTHLPNFVSHMISSETFEIFTSLDGMSMEFFF